MSGRLANAAATIRAVAESGRDISIVALWPPRRAILVAGIVAVSICVLIGTSLATVALVGGTALAPFFMGHVERKMHPAPRRSGERVAEHSTDESAENHTHSTTTTTTETK